MWVIAVIVLVVFGAGRAPADILEWRDAGGVTHYTNLKEDVPNDQRDSAQVVVNEMVHHPETADKSAAAPPAKAEPRRQAQVIYDRPTASEAYLEGLVRGLEAARGGGGGGTGGSVQINGPLAVASAPSPASTGYWPPYYPLLTTSFDRGRSRHLTLRLLLQDQFAIDREGLSNGLARRSPTCR